MLETYQGILRDNHIEWVGDAPPVPESAGVRVQVTLLDRVPLPDDEATRGQRMAAVLEQLAVRGGVASIPDPDAWQREERQDRRQGRQEQTDPQPHCMVTHMGLTHTTCPALLGGSGACKPRT